MSATAPNSSNRMKWCDHEVQSEGDQPGRMRQQSFNWWFVNKRLGENRTVGKTSCPPSVLFHLTWFPECLLCSRFLDPGSNYIHSGRLSVKISLWEVSKCFSSLQEQKLNSLSLRMQRHCLQPIVITHIREGKKESAPWNTRPVMGLLLALLCTWHWNRSLFQFKSTLTLTLTFPLPSPVTGTFWYFSSSLVHLFLLHVQNTAVCSFKRTSSVYIYIWMLYNLKARQTIEKMTRTVVLPVSCQPRSNLS